VSFFFVLSLQPSFSFPSPFLCCVGGRTFSKKNEKAAAAAAAERRKKERETLDPV
jgi:hypothetical protein